MIPGLYYALSAIKAGTDRFQVSSNNVANISTPGYKAKVSYISELSKGGVVMYSVSSDEGQSYLINTGRPLDLAINGNGYFQLNNESGNPILSRNGVFGVDANGDIVDVKGNRLGINVGTDANNIVVDNNGNVYADNELKGQISIVDKYGRAIPQENYEILPGYLEASNVDIAKEIVESITTLRYIQSNIKTVKTVDEMLGNIINITG